MRVLKAVLLLVALTPAMLLADTKVAVINLEQAIEASEEGIKFTNYLKKEYASKRNDLQKLADSGKALKEEFEKSGVFLSEDERDAKRFEVQQKAKEFEMMRRSLAKSMDTDRREFLQKMGPKVNKAIELLTKDQNVDVLLRSESLVYAKPEFDLTTELTEALNKVD